MVAAVGRLIAGGVTDHQQELLATITGEARSVDAGLGLYDPARRAPRTWPARAKTTLAGEVGRPIVSTLDDLAEAHRDDQFMLVNWQGSREILLADAQWLPSPFARNFRPNSADDEEEGSGLILAETFRIWWANRQEICVPGPSMLSAPTRRLRPPPTRPSPPGNARMWRRTAASFDLQAAQISGSVAERSATESWSSMSCRGFYSTKRPLRPSACASTAPRTLWPASLAN